uniref:Uncharacterized protein n=1 Tax=Parascaris equorum TaxID=6256 RepID=A0A914RV72_PAREQ
MQHFLINLHGAGFQCRVRQVVKRAAQLLPRRCEIIS